MTDMKTITVPPADELLRRLLAVDDEPYMDVFYRILLNAESRRITGQGIAVHLTLSMTDYTAGHPTVVTMAMTEMLHEFVPAFTDDPEVQADALDHLKASGLPDGR